MSVPPTDPLPEIAQWKTFPHEARLHYNLMFIVVIALILAGNLVWWRWAHQRVRIFPRARVWQITVASFALAQLGYMLFFVLAPVYARRIHPWLPMPLVAFMYIWDLMVLPLTLLGIAVGGLVRWINRRRKSGGEKDDSARLTRRQWLTATAATLPPLLAASGA